MAIYGFLDVLLGFFACAGISSISAALFLSWRPLLEQVRDSCKAGNTHPKRCRLLWVAGLSPTAWMLALLLYIRNVIALWHIMMNAIRNGFFKRFIYTLLDVYFALVIIAGVGGVLVTVWFLWRRRRELSDLVTIIRFNPGIDRRQSEPEVQTTHPSHSPPTSPPPPPPAAPSQSPLLPGPTADAPIELSNWQNGRDTAISDDDGHRNQSDRGTHKEPTLPPVNEEATQPEHQERDPIQRSFRKNTYHFQIAKDIMYRQAARDSKGNVNGDTPPCPSPNSAGEPPSLVTDHGSEGSDSYHDSSPRSLCPASRNLDEVEECSLSRCSSCSESHISTIPQTRAASIREPLTPTSPSRDFDSSANPWAESASSSPRYGEGDVHVPLLSSSMGAIERNPDQNEDISVVSTVSDIGDTFQDALERYGLEIAGPANESAVIPPEASIQPESETNGDSSEPWTERFERLTAEGIDPEGTIAGVDAQLQQEASKESKDHEAKQESFARKQQSLRVDDRGQAITAALALQRGIPSPPHQTPISASALPLPGRGSNVPNAPPRSPWARDPPRPQRVMADPRTVNLAHVERPNPRRIFSPRLTRPTLENEAPRPNERERNREVDAKVEDWMATSKHPGGEKWW